MLVSTDGSTWSGVSTGTDANAVIVSGDFTLDWNLARSPGLEAQIGGFAVKKHGATTRTGYL